jgi:hypothetical protein
MVEEQATVPGNQREPSIKQSQILRNVVSLLRTPEDKTHNNHRWEDLRAYANSLRFSEADLIIKLQFSARTADLLVIVLF